MCLNVVILVLRWQGSSSLRVSQHVSVLSGIAQNDTPDMHTEI